MNKVASSPLNPATLKKGFVLLIKPNNPSWKESWCLGRPTLHGSKVTVGNMGGRVPVRRKEMWGLLECLSDAYWQEGHSSSLLSNYLEYCGKAGKDFLALDSPLGTEWPCSLPLDLFC